jgi:SepF-like predicted cell division protein (DUF552 family)
MVFSKIKELLSGSSDFENGNYEDYLEIDTSQAKVQKNKIIIRPFTINEFNDVKPALDAIREGYTVALINIRPLKDKDLVELKRAVNKLKKTCDAIDGDIAGFGEDWVVVTPSFARVYRSQDMSEVEE